MITKGYGFSIDDIDWSCPADLKPYAKAYELEQKKIDENNWFLGQYFAHALNSTVCNAFLWRSKSDAPGKYPERPFLYDAKESRGELSEEEKQREVDLFFAQEKARRINWKRTHKKKD